MTEAALSIERLTVSLARAGRPLLHDVSLSVAPGEIVGLVGESGCGKSTLINTVLGLLPPAMAAGAGSVRLAGKEVLGLSERRLAREVRGKRIGFVPQDPSLALNPCFTVEQQLMEIWRSAPQQRRSGRGAGRARLVELLRQVQIPDAEQALGRYPHEFSGGQRQRILIAAALLLDPQVIVADEPTAALDVTIQKQVLAIFRELAQRNGVGILFVTHDFGVVAELCDRVYVMYAGQIVEQGPAAEILYRTAHPYTEALIRCHPDRMEELQGIPGIIPGAADLPPGCRFHTRCAFSVAACAVRAAHWTEVGPGHRVNCIRAEGSRAA